MGEHLSKPILEQDRKQQQVDRMIGWGSPGVGVGGAVEDWRGALFPRLAGLRHQECFTDTRLISRDHRVVTAHCLVLAAVSPQLAALLSADAADAEGHFTILLPTTSGSLLEAAIAAIYSGHLS